MRLAKILSLSFLFLLISCGASEEEKRLQALTSAELLLTKGLCNEAMAKINSITPALINNSLYIKLKASSYACLAGYSSVDFFTNDLSKISADLFSGFSTFEMAQTYTGPGDYDYEDLQNAINTLLYAGGLRTDRNPSSALRAEVFKSSDNSEINSFLLFLTMNQLGKFVYHYGTTSVTGGKGDGAEKCFFDYKNNMDGGALTAILAAGGGTCTSDTGLTGHADLTSGGLMHLSRACEGIVLFNNFRDTVANLSSLDDVSAGLGATMTALELALASITFTDSSIVTVRSQAKCEADFGGGAGVDDEDLQKYYGYIFETLHNRMP